MTLIYNLGKIFFYFIFSSLFINSVSIANEKKLLSLIKFNNCKFRSVQHINLKMPIKKYIYDNFFIF